MAAITTQPRIDDHADVPTVHDDTGEVLLCPAPARVVDRFVLESTDGPIEHVKTHCNNGHGFTPRVGSR